MTDTANRTVEALVHRATDDDSAGLRIASRSEAGYEVQIVGSPEPGDVVLETARVYLDPDVAETLSQSTLDATDDGRLMLTHQ